MKTNRLHAKFTSCGAAGPCTVASSDGGSGDSPKQRSDSPRTRVRSVYWARALTASVMWMCRLWVEPRGTPAARAAELSGLSGLVGSVSGRLALSVVGMDPSNGLAVLR